MTARTKTLMCAPMSDNSMAAECASVMRIESEN
jgi:hypothetical protein